MSRRLSSRNVSNSSKSGAKLGAIGRHPRAASGSSVAEGLGQYGNEFAVLTLESSIFG